MTHSGTAAGLQDEHDIAALMTGWIHRDVGDWNALAGLFHPGATISLSWFTGTSSEFIAGSARMADTDLRTKHVVASPVIRFDPAGNRAVTETNAIVVAENTAMQLGAVAHTRFLDRVERRNGRWAINERSALYDFSYFTFPAGPVPVASDQLSRYRPECAALAYVLERSGFPVTETFVVRGSTTERDLKSAAAMWLDAASAR
ncbi:nuclear transport factor 2 family protein [Amycolatopsis sp. lyj-23]|uniref:nuclear transport factor 2 family protein n=1 Tax=Amycolatopsis sp. lyj-23 TaxID=2789283 RepID=UPI00397877EC